MISRILHLDVHLIQSYPYSNLNRDRHGTPKTATYGGVQRARLSSQNTKRHIRQEVEKIIGLRAVRTRGIPQAVAKLLVAAGWDPKDALTAGQLLILAAAVQGLGIAEGGGTNALLFLPDTAITALADVAQAHREGLLRAIAAVVADEEKAAAKAARKTAAKDTDEADPQEDEEDEEESARSALLAKHVTKAAPKDGPKDALKKDVLKVLQSKNASVAAFGRMLANESGSTVTGAVQMAHGVSTHSVVIQTDFFTAVDDLQQAAGEERGAGHMGDNRFTSATFYRYGPLNVGELLRDLDPEIARQVIAEYLRALVTTILPAKGSGTAPYTVPHLVYVALRTDRPVSLVGAFETPIPATTAGYLPASLTALDEHAAAHHRFLGRANVLADFHTGLSPQTYPALGERTEGLDDLITRILDTLAKEGQ
ncbi:type I-E CRISPR-associated protein Cas7/Cse4/CasC [Streptacidiphilus sp. N1-10]|uniref:Type I-E CRISPR-associated protein Cas7/Cse4/CasC n=1 Tax=Streptacidiphilus jeojiensis TaxID=3229225 RepID=A0ABV6XYF5_9ACTN